MLVERATAVRSVPVPEAIGFEGDDEMGELAKLTVEAEAVSPTGRATNEQKGHWNHRSAGEELWRRNTAIRADLLK